MKRTQIMAITLSFLMMIMSAIPVFAGTWTEHKDNTWTYVDDNGESVTGWIEDGEKTYYLGDDGYLKTGWFKVKGSWYYFDKDGVMAKNTWIDNYYVNAEGKMKEIR